MNIWQTDGTPVFPVFDERELGEKCMCCGKRYLTVYHVPDEVWEKINPIPSKPGAGLLCIACADSLMQKAGIVLCWEATANKYTDERRASPDLDLIRKLRDACRLAAEMWFSDDEGRAAVYACRAALARATAYLEQVLPGPSGDHKKGG